jgi:hypothetical protein
VPRWHFVGRLQSRKCRSVARYAAAVHSVDRLDLVPLLGDGAQRAERERMDVFIQVSLDGDPARGGIDADSVPALAAAIAATAPLVLRGVMAVAPLGADPGPAFDRLGDLSRRLRENYPGADSISAGMSNDFDIALRHGATHVRVGSALLGRRSVAFG